MNTKKILLAMGSSLLLAGTMFVTGCTSTPAVSGDDMVTSRDMAMATSGDMAMAAGDMTVVPDMGCYGKPNASSTALQIINACPAPGVTAVAANPVLPLLVQPGNKLPPLPQ